MKNLTTFVVESLLDKDFDVPDFNFEPITPNIPVMIDDGEHWRQIVSTINAKLIPYAHYMEINRLINDVGDIIAAINRENVAITELGKIGTALNALAKCNPLEIDHKLLNDAANVRVLNDWIGKANNNSDFKKLVSGLGGYFYGHIGERATRSGKLYGYLTYTLLSPNENAVTQLTKIADKLSKIDSRIVCDFQKTGDGDGIFAVKLIKSAS